MVCIFKCFVLAFMFMWLSVAIAIEDDEFLAELKKSGEIYKKFEESPEAVQLFKIGRKSEVNKRL